MGRLAVGVVHVVVAAAVQGLAAAAAPTAKPNVLMIVIDDLGFDDMGFRMELNGQPAQIDTKNVDKLAREGVVLDAYYVQCVCSPSRVTFLTGRYPLHHGINDWIPPSSSYGMPLNETTIADHFKSAGFKTHAIGKWHAGFYTDEFTPTFRGFDSFYGFYTGGEDYFTHNAGGYDFHRDPEPNCHQSNCSQVAWEDKGKYSTIAFAEEAVNVIQAHQTASPLFMYLAFQAVHAPPEVPKYYVPIYGSQIEDAKRANFAGMLGAMDQGVGNVTAALTKKGMMENIIIVFTADNGGPTTTGDAVGSRNWPLKGGKHSIWEGGTRATSCVWSPSHLGTNPDKSHYLLYDNLMHASDWLPTLVLAAGGSTTGSLPLDGYNQWPSLQALVARANGKSVPTVEAPRKEVFYGSPDEQKTCYGSAQHTRSGGGLCLDQNAIRIGKWKLIVGDGGTPNTWFAPVNASQEEHEAEQAQCADADETYLVGFQNTESPFLLPSVNNMPVAAKKEDEVAWSCTNQTTWNEGECRPGGTAVGMASVANAAACCHKCAEHEGCAAWVYRSDRAKGDNCWLKDSNSKTTKDHACTSAGVGPIPPVPPPPGPPPPPQLFDVVADPGEHHNVASSNADVVSRLLDRLNTYLDQRCGPASSCPCYGGVPTASNNAKCGPATKKNNSHVGPVVGPWCTL